MYIDNAGVVQAGGYGWDVSFRHGVAVASVPTDRPQLAPTGRVFVFTQRKAQLLNTERLHLILKGNKMKVKREAFGSDGKMVMRDGAIPAAIQPEYPTFSTKMFFISECLGRDVK